MFVFFLIGATLMGCQRQPPPRAGAGPLTLAALKNGTFLTEFERSGRVRLVNGLYENAPEHLAIQLASDRVARGDLNGDGAEDAVCLLTTESGGSGTFVDLAVVLNRKGLPENVARLQLGDRVIINGVRVEGRSIVVEMVTHGPGDALCCPTLAVVRRFQLERGALREAAA